MARWRCVDMRRCFGGARGFAIRGSPSRSRCLPRGGGVEDGPSARVLGGNGAGFCGEFKHVRLPQQRKEFVFSLISSR